MMQLDEQQRAAVYTDSKKALVLAGAGSGKTRVVIERIAHLIENKKVSPYEIMSFTFTRKAAGEMKDRLHKRIGGAAYKITMGTMHALALDYTHRFGEIIGLKARSVTVYSQWEEDYLLRDVAVSLGILKGKSWKVPKKDISGAFNAYYSRGIVPEKDTSVRTILDEFMLRCKENNSLTYGGLLVGLKLLIPHIAQYLKTRYLFVDETQDLDPMQWSIVNLICDVTGAALFAVGDYDQSIYSFRGATPEYLIDHQHEFDIYRIETNYRSDANIVYAANRLIEHNQTRLPKTMVPHRETQNDIEIKFDIDSAGIVQLFKNNSGERCILGRNHKLLQKISDLLNEAGVEHEYIGKDTALTNKEGFRRFHAFLKLIVNPYDNFSFLLIRELIGLDRQEYAKVRLEAVQFSKSHFLSWYDRCASDFTSFFTSSFYENASSDNLFLQIIHRLNDLLGFDSSGAFNQAADFALKWFSQGRGKTLQDYLSWLATYDIQDEIKEEYKGLQLMTIHASKGLEFPEVIIAGSNEGILPSKQAIKNDGIEDERRLAYVAWTRAEDRLILTVRPEKTVIKDRVYLSPMSMFIYESMDKKESSNG